MDERGVTTAAIAAEVPCHEESVRRVVDKETVYDTPKQKRIKQLIADRVGFPVAELWPDDEQPLEARNGRAEPEGVE